MTKSPRPPLQQKSKLLGDTNPWKYFILYQLGWKDSTFKKLRNNTNRQADRTNQPYLTSYHGHCFRLGYVDEKMTKLDP